MKTFLLDSNPNFGESMCTISDKDGNSAAYKLTQIKGNGCHLAVTDLTTGLEKDAVNFSKMDLRALFLLLTVKTPQEAKVCV
jgi:hypothetical protein